MSLNKFIFFSVFLYGSALLAPFGFNLQAQKNITLVLDPAGDSQQTGRKVNDRYERSITLQCAQELKKICSQAINNINIVITRTAGQTRTEFDTAQLANRLQADLVIYIGAYQQTEGPTTIDIYRFSYNPYFLPKLVPDYAFIPYDKAYVQSAPYSEQYATLIKEFLEQDEYRRVFATKGIFALPYKPLIGIQMPSIGIELGLNHGSDWQLLLNPLSQTIINVIQSLQKHHHE